MIIIAMLILPTFTGFTEVYSDSPVSQGNGWGVFSVEAHGLAVYDYDGDNVQEVIVSPDKIIDIYSLFQGPYKNLENLEVISDYLITYGSSGVRVFEGMNQVYSYANVHQVTSDLEKQGFILDDKVITAYKTWDIFIPSSNPVLAFRYNSPIIAYQSTVNGNINIIYNGHTHEISIKAQPIAAHVVGSSLFILAKTTSQLVLVDVTNMTTWDFITEGLSLPTNSTVIGFDIPEASFVVAARGMIYLAGLNGTVTLFPARPLCTYGSDMLILQQDKIVDFNGYSGLIIKSFPLPPINNIKYAACNRNVIAVSDGSNVAVYYPAEKPRLTIIADRTVFALSPLYYRVDYSGAENVLVTVNGSIINTVGSIVFNRSGVYRMKAVASNKFMESTAYADITVLPRPLKIDIKFNETPVVFKKAVVTVETYDALTNKKVITPCTMTVPGLSKPLLTDSWMQESFFVKPTPGTYAVSVTCGDGEVYQKTNSSLAMIVKPAQTFLEVRHPYKGVVVFYIADELGQLVRGKISIACCNGTVESSNPLTFQLSPGNHSALVTFTPYESYYQPLKARVQLVYSTSVNETMKGYKVYVEKVPYNVTKTLTQIIPTTLTKSVKQTNYMALALAVVVTAIASPVVYHYMHEKGLLAKISAFFSRKPKEEVAEAGEEETGEELG